MVRGNAKVKAQEKNAKKLAEKTSSKSSLGLENKSLTVTCEICKAQMKNLKQMKEHYESKHPKAQVPPECNQQQRFFFLERERERDEDEDEDDFQTYEEALILSRDSTYLVSAVSVL